MDTILCDYTDVLMKTLNGNYGDASLSLPMPSDKPTHHFLPGSDQITQPKEGLGQQKQQIS